MNKRGQGLQVSTIILIVLGIAVLVVLVLGFTMGWDKLFPFLSPENNVETIVTQCRTACLSGSTYNFCTLNRKLYTEKGVAAVVKPCKELSTYGVDACPDLC